MQRFLSDHSGIAECPPSNEYAGKTILLTGAGGYIGSALARRILSERPHEVVLLDHSEQALYQLGRSLSGFEGVARYRLVPGDVGDCRLIAALLETHRPHLIVHAAAYKQVPLMEENPFAAVQNNAVLTWQLAKAAADFGVPKLLLISTDKAANPRSILGASKRVAELAVLRWCSTSRRYAAIRLVNVFGSTGSVVPLFREQISRGGPLTITHPDAARYFLTLEDTIALITVVAAIAEPGLVYVPKLSEATRIMDLAKVLLRDEGASAPEAILTTFVNLRPGEKVVEDLRSSDESLAPTGNAAFDALTAPRVPAESFDQDLLHLKEKVQIRDLPALLEMLCRLVPTYQPSVTLCLGEKAADD